MIPLLAQAVGIGDYLAVLTIPVMPAIVFWSWRWQRRQAERRFTEWAERSSYYIIGRSYRLFFRGPFYWCSDAGQAVFRVVVGDPMGNRRTGWMRFGGWWRGIQSDKVAELWDENERPI